jgi:hypothetical protein
MNKRCASFQVMIAGFMLAALAFIGCRSPAGGNTPGKSPGLNNPTSGSSSDVVDFDALNDIDGIDVTGGGGGGGRG